MTGIKLLREEDTAAFAQQVAQMVRRGDSVGLRGGLGAGKTTFVRYLVQACGGDPRDVSSPSYSLQNEYRLPARGVLEHWDLYRLQDTPLELLELPEQNTIRVVEWPERSAEVSRDVALDLYFEVHQDGSRTVTVTQRN